MTVSAASGSTTSLCLSSLSFIAKGGHRADILAAAPLVVEHLPDLLGSLKTVIVVHNIGDRHLNVGNAIRVKEAVYILREGDKADAHLHKQVVDQASGIAVIAGQPGEVFHHDAVNFAVHNVGHHRLKLLPVGVRPRVSVVNVLRDAFKLLNVGLVKVIENVPLVFDAVAAIQPLFDFLQILLGEPDVACHFPAAGGAGRGGIRGGKHLMPSIFLP